MFSELQKRKLTRYFRVYDMNNDGRVAASDFERVVENLRALHDLDVESARFAEIRDGFMSRWDNMRWWADRDSDGSLDLVEWLRYWDELLSRKQRYEDEVAAVLKRVLSLFDTDDDGVIGPGEFASFYDVYGLDSSLASEVFERLDANGDGVISREELETISEQFFLERSDAEARGNHLYGPY